ncbi:MAG: serine/threonine protein kinase, partial [Deltaproteobacteria bacterium]
MLMTLQGQTYVLREVLRQNVRTTLYRGLRRSDSLPVIIKLLEPKHYRARDLARLEHEYHIGGRLQHNDVVIHPLDIDTQGPSPALVLEDVGGKTLDQVPGPLGIAAFLPLAIKIAEALDRLHHDNIVHKDLKPQNIVVDADLQTVHLTDFGIAARLETEAAVLSGSFIEGTLAYLSPEQTGRMARAVDLRSDLYSLGVTYYELLTGRLPFSAKDSLEWIHCHIAMTPASPSTLDERIDVPLSNLVLKLLAKVGEDRYQTARGLLCDLRLCLEMHQQHGRIEPFALAAHDVSERFAIPQKLYGRQAE